MMKRTKRILAFLLASTVSLTALAGCGGTASGTDAQSTPSKGSSAETSTGSSDADSLLIGLTQSSMVTDYEDNYFTNYLEEQLGFELEFYMLPAESTETRTKVSLMATSNESLPDVLVVDNHLTPEMILQYGSNGFFLPLNAYLEDPEVMPNYNAIPSEDRAAMDKAQTMADGNMYSLASYEPETWNFTPNRLFINRAWLDQLNLSVPTTTDELKEVLIALRDGDPNGNGVQDELGVYGFSAGGYGENITASLMNAFVFWNANAANNGLSLSEDGTTVIAPFVTEEWREGLRYMNDLYREGVLSANIFTDDITQFKAILNQETPIVGLTSTGSLSVWPDVANNENFLQMEMIEPLKGPKGVQYVPYTAYSPGQELMILASTEKLDMALKFADQFFDHDTSIIERFGEENVDWTRDPEILAQNANAYVDAGIYDSLSLVVISSVWAENQNQTWRNHGPRYASMEMGNTFFDYASGKSFDPDDPTQLFAKSYEINYPKHPAHILPQLKYTAQEAEEIQDQLTGFNDVVKQCLAEFVTGERDLDSGWDSYLSELDTMGLQQWLAVAQTAYTRDQ